MRRSLRTLCSTTESFLQNSPLRFLVRRPQISTGTALHPPKKSCTGVTRISRSGLLAVATAAVAVSYNMSGGGNWWVPSSDAQLEEAETRVFSALKSEIELSFVELENGYRVRSMIVNRGKHPDKVPLVIVHGFAAAIGTWAMNIDEFAEHRTVYALDQVGFGRSDRPEFSKDAQEAEAEFVENLEQWRREMNLDSFILLGHSLGGFVAASFTLKYPEHVKHLILAEPWGFPTRPEETTWEREMPIRYKLLTFLNDKLNPLSILRGAGPLGPRLMRRARPDIQEIFAEKYPDSCMLDYIYHCNAQQPSGEVAMKSLMKGIGYAEYPMLERIGNLPKDLGVNFIYGKHSWNSFSNGDKAVDILGDHRSESVVIEDATHHVYGFYGFNQLVNHFSKQADTTTS